MSHGMANPEKREGAKIKKMASPTGFEPVLPG